MYLYNHSTIDVRLHKETKTVYMTRSICSLILAGLITSSISAQKLSKGDKAIVSGLKSHITYLADDKLEGRRAGTAGEKMAMDYISTQFAKAGLVPKGEQGW